MNSNIQDVCNELDEFVNSDINREDLFSMCVQNRLMDVYNRQEKEFDDSLTKLEACVDYNDIKRMKIYTSRLARFAGRERSRLIECVKKLGSEVNTK
jgi:hypothetical protein